MNARVSSILRSLPIDLYFRNYLNQYLMKRLYLLSFFALLLSLNAFTQFSGSYAPVNWTVTKTSGPGIVNTASVNASGAPSSVTITGSDDPSNPFTTTPVDIDYTIVAAASGTWSFNWSYVTNDQDLDPQWDVAGVLVGGVFTQLSANTLNLVNQSGTFSRAVTAGAVIGFRIRAIDNSYGTASFTISGLTAPATTLPVLLNQFTATAKAGKVLLTWNVTSEINTSHFETERSEGNHFEKIGTVKAVSSTASYSFTDVSPLEGRNYYRLRIVDNDANFSYSPIRTTRLLSSNQLQLYPNPASASIRVSLHTVNGGTEKLDLYNSAGCLLQSRIISLEPGVNRTTLDISMIPKGLYHVSAEGSGWVQSFVKN
jgi:hypothetical protein